VSILRIPYKEANTYYVYRQHPKSVCAQAKAGSSLKLAILKREANLFPQDEDINKSIAYWTNLIRIEKKQRLRKILDLIQLGKIASLIKS
jgi:hypothetical protein